MLGVLPQQRALLRHLAVEDIPGVPGGQGVAALIATHNMELARYMDRVFALKDGHLEERPAESHAY